MRAESTANDAVTPAHAELRREPDGTVLTLSGALVLETPSMARRQVEALLRATPVALLRSTRAGWIVETCRGCPCSTSWRRAAVSEMAGELRQSGSSVVLTLRFRVFSNPDGAHQAEEILLKTCSSTLPIPPTSAKEVVTGWNQGLADIMVEFQTDLRAALVASSLLSSESDIGTGPSRRSGRK